MGKLTGKVAVVTGASKGIGAGIAKLLAREGASVVVNYASDKSGAEKVADGDIAVPGHMIRLLRLQNTPELTATGTTGTPSVLYMRTIPCR